jgi:siroheme synthase-like protein
MYAQSDSNALAGTNKVSPAAGSVSLPMFLSLQNRRVLVVGGGPVAASKVTTLLSAGATITLVAPSVVPDAIRPGVSVKKRLFREQDLRDVWLVVAAAHAAINARVARAATRRRIFVNTVDDPLHATACFGGIVRRGDVTLAFSSGGSAPGLVRLLREAFDDLLPQDLTTWLEMAKAERQEWLRRRTNIGQRVPLLAAAITRLYADSKPPVKNEALESL